jgi:hypothetical protein
VRGSSSGYLEYDDEDEFLGVPVIVVQEDFVGEEGTGPTERDEESIKEAAQFVQL